MHELVTDNINAYERMALKLACQPEFLKATREKLMGNRNVMPLFDIPQLVQNVESAFTVMLQIHNSGEAPRASASETKCYERFVGVIPAAGLASRLGPLGYPKSCCPLLTWRQKAATCDLCR